MSENSTANPVTTGGVTLPPHSLYVCVNGGLDTDVALAIMRKKTPGCASVGTSSVVVADPNAAYAKHPQYTVQFTRAQATPVYVAVVLAGGASVPSTAVADVQAALVAGFEGATGTQRVPIGGTVYASNFYSSVSSVGDWVKIVGITVGLAAQPVASTVQVNIDRSLLFQPQQLLCRCSDGGRAADFFIPVCQCAAYAGTGCWLEPDARPRRPD